MDDCNSLDNGILILIHPYNSLDFAIFERLVSNSPNLSLSLGTLITQVSEIWYVNSVK